MNLIQLKFPNNLTAVGVLEENKIINLTAQNKDIDTTYKLFMELIKNSITIEEFLEPKIKNCPVFEFNYEELISDPKKFDVNILPPITHPDPYRLFISGTGLTHTGSVKSRDMMHNDDDEKKDQTDSAKMFEMGLKGGKPSSGEIILNGRSIENERDFFLAKIRNEMIGFVFQFHFLLPEFTALENVMIPILVGGKSRITSREKAQKLLLDLDMSARMNHRPSELSGGEQQRVAIARALANEPQIVLADEPTGNLDSSNTNRIYELLKEINSKTRQTFLIVTHNSVLSERMDKKVHIVDGLINEQ